VQLRERDLRRILLPSSPRLQASVDLHTCPCFRCSPLAEGAPVLVRLIAQIASRFGVVVTQKLAAQAVPFIGAVGGAAVNYAFIDHFQEVARAHFIVRRLERRYGKDTVRAAYDRLSSQASAAA
jgi:hypothetical protein